MMLVVVTIVVLNPDIVLLFIMGVIILIRFIGIKNNFSYSNLFTYY